MTRFLGPISDAQRVAVLRFTESALRQQGPFVEGICARLVLTEVVVLPREEDGKVRARVVFEIDMTPDMRSSTGMLHSGCAMFLMHVCTSIALRSLGVTVQRHNELATSSIDAVFHAPASVGSRLRVVNDTVWLASRTGSANTEIWDVSGRKMIAIGVHNGLQISAARL